MAWILQDDNDKVIISEIQQQTDRGVMIIGASLLEGRLMQSIQLRMMPDMPTDMGGRMFKGSGPLASFSAKIDIGFLLQLYPKEMRDVMHTLREIRNDAAHKTDAISFSFQSTKDRCENLRHALPFAHFAGVKHSTRLRMATESMRTSSLETSPPLRAMSDDGEVADGVGYAIHDAKSSFIGGIKMMLVHLRFVNDISERIRIVLPPLPGRPE